MYIIIIILYVISLIYISFVKHTPYDTSASDKCIACSTNSSKYSVKEVSVSSETFSNCTDVNSL